jgi:hypothetical protein
MNAATAKTAKTANPVTRSDVPGPKAPTAIDPMAAMMAELESLRAQNAALKAKKAGLMTCKVSEKGAVSVYGLGRFPVTLYQEQWNKLLDRADEIRAFIAAHSGELSSKQ